MSASEGATLIGDDLRAPLVSPACVYDFATSVSRVYCDRRAGYETLTATGCATLFRFPEGDYMHARSADPSAHDILENT